MVFSERYSSRACEKHVSPFFQGDNSKNEHYDASTKHTTSCLQAYLLLLILVSLMSASGLLSATSYFLVLALMSVSALQSRRLLLSLALSSDGNKTILSAASLPADNLNLWRGQRAAGITGFDEYVFKSGFIL